MEREEHLAEQIEFTSGLGLLYMGPEGTSDEFTNRIMRAHATGDLDELDHVAAIMISLMAARGQDVEYVLKRWAELDRDYHQNFCDCVDRGEHERK